MPPKALVRCNTCAAALAPSLSSASPAVVTTCASCLATFQAQRCAGCGALLLASSAPLHRAGLRVFHASCHALLSADPAPAAAAAAARSAPALSGVPQRRSVRRSRPVAPSAAAAAAAAAAPLPSAAFRAASLEGLLLRARAMGLVREHASAPGCSTLGAAEFVAFLCATGQCAERWEALLMGQALLDHGLLARAPGAAGGGGGGGAAAVFCADGYFVLRTGGAAAARAPPPAAAPPDASEEAMARRDTLASILSSLEGDDAAAEEHRSVSFSREGGDAPAAGAGAAAEEGPATPGMEGSAKRPSSGARQGRLPRTPAPLHPQAPTTPASTLRSSSSSSSSSTPLLAGLASRLSSAFKAATAGIRGRTLSTVEELDRRASTSTSMSVSGSGSGSQSTAGEEGGVGADAGAGVGAGGGAVSARSELSQRIWWAGWLFKQGHVRLTWRRRWFVLEGHTLRYYRRGPLDSSAAALAFLPPLVPAPGGGGAAGPAGAAALPPPPTREELLSQLCPPNGLAPAGSLDIREYTLEAAGGAGGKGCSQLAMRLASRLAAHQQFLFVAETESEFVAWVKVFSVSIKEWERQGRG